MKVGVIGGSGFIGSRVVPALIEAGHYVRVLDIQPSKLEGVDYACCDVRDVETLLANINDLDVLVNLAAEHRDDVTPKSLYYDVNVSGAKNVCAAARACGVKKMLFTSSVAVYGNAPEGTGESGEINPFNEYGVTKYQAEEVYRKWYEELPGKGSLIIVRPVVVFGEGNRGNVYNLVNQIVRGKFVMIGDGRNKKSMAYVENVAGFLVHLIEYCDGYSLYNFSDKPDLTMNELVSCIRENAGMTPKPNLRLPYILGLGAGYCFDLLAKIVRRKLPISSIRVKKFCSSSMFSTAAEGAGYTSKYKLESGLKRTVEDVIKCS